MLTEEIEGASDMSLEEIELVKEIQARFKAAKNHYAAWEEEAREDYRFALGDQWTEEERQKLREQARPCMTFNRIRPLISIVSGYQRENSSRIKVNPEGGEDRIFSEVMDRAIKSIDKWAHLAFKMGYWFDDGLYCGKGFMEAIIKYDQDPIRGQIAFKQLSPYQIKVDPSCLEYDLNEGAEYCFKIVRMTKSRIKELYPDKKTLIDGFIVDNDDQVENGSGILKEGSLDDYGNRPNVTTVASPRTEDEDPQLEKDGKFTIKEYWRMKMVKRWYVVDKEDGEAEEFKTKDLAEAFVAAQDFGTPVDRLVSEMWVSAYCCGFLLQNARSPFEPHYCGFPFFRFLADWAPNAESEEFRVQGLTRPLKDAQREKNKSKSQYLHILNTQANSGWIGDENALTKQGWQKLEQMGSKPGITVRKKQGTELREILPKGPNQGHIQREKDADEEFKQISSINPDLMGMQDGTASGRAISLRIKQAILALVRVFANYRYSKEIIGNFLMAMVPMIYDAKKLSKVLGADYMSKAVDPVKYPGGLNQGNLMAFLTMISDAKYDVFVAEADQNATIRFETFQELSELLKSGAPIPVDLLIDYMDLPNSEEVKQKIKEQQAQQMAAASSAKGTPGAQ